MRRLITVILLFLCGWLGGFWLFWQQTQLSPLLHHAQAEAIVVLTGGAQRIEYGFNLLDEGRAPRIHISGVGGKAIRADILRRAAISTEQEQDLQASDKLTLDDVADSTFTNAEETAKWVMSEKVTSILLVTANYHMPRSLLLFADKMPDLTVIPAPVFPLDAKDLRWWEDADLRWLMVQEYHKYLAVLAWVQWRQLWHHA